MSQSVVPVIPYADSTAGKPFTTRTVLEALPNGLRATVPGVGAPRFFAGFLGHAGVFGFVMIAIVAGAASAESMELAWIGFVIGVALLLIISSSSNQLLKTASNTTVIQINAGLIDIACPDGTRLRYTVRDIQAFYPQATGTSLRLRSLGELRLGGRWLLPPILLKQYDLIEVVWVAGILNEELARQRAAATGQAMA